MTTDKNSYLVGETVFLTVRVTDGGPVDSYVRLELLTASGLLLSAEGQTGPDGEITFSTTITRRMGSGTYTATGYAPWPAWIVKDIHQFTVQ